MDNFKSVNDKHHHWKGDEYLRNFSSMISSESRRNTQDALRHLSLANMNPATEPRK